MYGQAQYKYTLLLLLLNYLHEDPLGGEGPAVLSDQGVGGVVHLLVRKVVDWPHLQSQVKM